MDKIMYRLKDQERNWSKWQDLIENINKNLYCHEAIVVEDHNEWFLQIAEIEAEKK